ncbi:MAG: nuclear transport factor 2 family protein [Acidobacteria bacterium]|nr:nuclear transport factor 2 family protein [Acidobacteriota bacterium]
MSTEENARIVKTIYDAFGRGDVATILDALADRFEWHHRGAPAVPWGKTRTTPEEVRSFFGELNAAVEVLDLQVQHYVAQGDIVVALGTFRGRSRKTGKEFDDPWAMAWTLKDGKVTGYRSYEDTEAIVSALR